MFAGPVNAPSALDLIASYRARFYRLYEQLASSPLYQAWTKIAALDDPAGDLIYFVYMDPLGRMPLWENERHSSSLDFHYWTQSVDRFGDQMRLDVDDIKSDSGNQLKQMMYAAAADEYARAASLLWPGLISDLIVAGPSLIWEPDGQKIFDLHDFKIGFSSQGTFRNYRSKTSEGGSAAFAMTAANILTVLTEGRKIKQPNGLDAPANYNMLFCSPSKGPLLRRLVKSDRLPSWEVTGQTAGSTAQGSDVPNPIRQQFGEIEVLEIPNMGVYADNLWGAVDTQSPDPNVRPIRLKKRQEVTWQFIGPGGAEIPWPTGSDEGAVSEIVFNTNGTKFGPKARGRAYFGNPWKIFLCDATP